MSIDLTVGIVRILNRSGQTTGTGFVVSDDGLIATCAHVVADAGAGPYDIVRLIFHQTGDEAAATVESDGWRAPDAENLAILSLSGPLPEGVKPLPLGFSTGVANHRFKTFGFPDVRIIDGLWGYGILGDKTTIFGQMVLQLTGTTEVTGGFSGAPVWDEVAGRVVGMVTATTDPDQRGRLIETAFAIPTETLFKVWPSLPHASPPLIGQPLPPPASLSSLQTMLPPGIRPGESPPFYRLDEYTFQQLCRDLFDAEPGIATCEVYGQRGQSQDGIDLLAHRQGGDGVEVGQCKCYARFSPSDIRRTSDEFFAHWDRWSQENVKRFILFVACDLSSKQQQDEVITQRQRFAEFGIAYEVWSAAKIRNKLRPHSAIVATYLAPPEYWVQAICGITSLPSPPIVPQEQTSYVVPALLVSQFEQLAAQLSVETERHLDMMRTALREGRQEEAINGLAEIKVDHARWSVLPAELKAKLLCFEASIVLDTTGDTNHARQLTDQACAFTPTSNEIRVRALIAYLEGDPEAAIEMLDDQDDVDSLNLKAALLLEMNRAVECRSVLEGASADSKPNPETLRIRALLLLATKDISQAQLEIQKALELGPRWRSIRFAAAVINYFSAVSPLALPARLVPWPEPVDWMLIKRNDESLSRLREAAEILQELAQTMGNAGEERHRFEAWRLACLANDPDRQEEAIEYAQAVLQTDRTDFRVIAWVVARNLEADLKPSRLALEQLVTNRSAHIFHIIALAGCYLASRNTQEAIKLLDDTKAIFQEHQAEALWTFWYIQSLVIGGKTEAASEAIDSSDLKADLHHAQTMTLLAEARETGNWQRLVQHLENSYEETRDTNYLLDICEVMAQQQSWDYIADRAETLIKAVGTDEAVRLAAIAAYNAGRFKFCLELLDSHQYLFRQRKLPNQLRQIRVACQQVLGLLPEAIVEAETLAREEPTVESLLALANLYLNKGDLKGLTIVGRKLNNRTDLMPKSLLGFARLVQWEDQGLAISFWRKAISQEIPDELVGEALALGFQLGLDDEVAPLLEKMAELGHQGKGGIQVKRVEDFVEFLKQHQEHTTKLDEIYRDGTGPIHLIAEQFSWSLVDLYHRILAENETIKDPMRLFALLARHGGRALRPGFPDSRPQWRPNLDITAILLAAHLNILTEVEETFKPLRIPATLIHALLHMRDRVSPHQPTRLQACRQITNLKERNALVVIQGEVPPDYPNTQLVAELGEEWVALFEEARISGGYLVGYLPLRKQVSSDPPTALPEDAAQYLVNCRSIAEALREQGPLSEEAYGDAIQALGTEGAAASETVPATGKPLYCYGNIPEVLADADLLHPACERFPVHIGQREFDRVQGALKEYEQRQAVADWLDRLIGRLNRGVDDGTYTIIPTPPYEEGEIEEQAAENPDVDCLQTILKFEAAEGDIIWADDRWLNSYLDRNGVPIIGINEILKSLVGAGTLKVGAYYQRIIRLRAANVCFVPVDTDEIIYHLRQARVESGRLVETQELKILRRYAAASLYRGHILQRPMMEGRPNEYGELAFLLGLGRAFTNVFVELWATGEDDEVTRTAHADWLLANLYIDHLGLFKVTGLPRAQQDDRYMIATSLTGLIVHATSFAPKRAAARRDYFDWLFHRILRKRFDADPNLVLLVADLLKKTLLDTIQREALQNLPEPVLIWLLQKFYDDLPVTIRDELGRDTDFMARIGLTNLPAITIDDFDFDENDFIRAANEAVNGRKANITPLGSEAEITFQPVEDHPGELIFAFDHPVTGDKKFVVGDNLVLWLGSPSQREALLRRKRQWFDCPQQKLGEIIAEIASMEEPQRRIEAVEVWRSTSAAEYYSNLDKKLRKQRDFHFDDLLPPSAEGLLRHLRLSPQVEPGEAFQEALATAAQTLIDEEDLVMAIDRLTGLPIPLPASLVGAFTALPLLDQRQLIKRLIRIAGSPLSRIHLVYLLLHSGNQVPALQRLARRIVRNLQSPEGTAAMEAFFAILKWVDGEVGGWPDARNWSAHVRLVIVWTHAHRLFSIFTSVGAPTSWLRDSFSQADQRIHFETFEWDSDYWFDTAHPRNVNQVAFLLAGLSYAFGKESNELIEKGLRDLVVGHAFMPIEGMRLPNLHLLRDSSQAPNSLNSFIGGDLGEKLSTFLGTEDAAIFTYASLQTLIEQTVDNMAEEGEVLLHWAWLHALLGDMPPPREVVDRLRSTLYQTDFEGLLEKTVELGLLAIQVASLQAKHLGDEELRLYLKDGLVKIAKRLAELKMTQGADVHEDNLSRQEDVDVVLLEAALHISKAVQPSGNVTAEFVDIVTQLLRTWSALIPKYRPIIQRLCEELPIAQAQEFWPLVVQLRGVDE